MTPLNAKKLADKAGYFFYYDRSLRMYSLYKKDLSDTAEYFTTSNLAGIDEHKFKERFLK